MTAERFCWCNAGTLQFTGRNWTGYKMPHMDEQGSPHRRELTDEEWAEAMTLTPYAEALTAERSEKKQSAEQK